MLTSSPASADSRLLLGLAGCERCSSAKATRAVKRSSGERGPASPAGRMSGRSRVSRTGEHGSLLPGFPASLRVEPGSDEARRMTAGSGRRLSAYYKKSGPLGRFTKILLESETWHLPGYALTWRESGTKCGSLVYRLRLSARPIDASDTGLWPTCQRRDVKGCTQNRQRIDALPNPLAALWPTPNVPNGGRQRKGGMSLTGQTRDGKKRQVGIQNVLMALCPTPKGPQGGACRTEKNIGHLHRMDDVTPASGEITSGCLARTESFVVRLTTLSAWLMGYTGAYLRHWEIASSRKSRRKSSAP